MTAKECSQPLCDKTYSK